MTSLKEKVAIILCVKDSKDFLIEQLDSIHIQEFVDCDIYVGNDGCSKETEKILTKHAKKIFSGPKDGFAKNFIYSLNNVPDNYDFYAFCDHDDVWMKSKLKHSIDCLRAYDKSEPNLYCGRTLLIDETGNEIGFSPSFKKKPSFLNALVQSIAGGNTMVFNKETKNLLSMVSLNKSIVSHDWLTYVLVSAVGGNIYYDNAPQIKYRIHKRNEIGSNKGLIAFYRRAKKVFNGSWESWISSNISQVNEIMPKIRVDLSTFRKFIRMRNEKNIFKRVYLFLDLGIYRQTFVGNVSLFLMIILKRI